MFATKLCLGLFEKFSNKSTEYNLLQEPTGIEYAFQTARFVRVGIVNLYGNNQSWTGG